MSYAELAVTTCFSFLRGAALPEEYVACAKALGLAALAVTDRNSLAGVVRAHAEAKKQGVRLIVGARLVFEDGTPDVLAYPQDRDAYGRLCRLLTTGNLRAPKGKCRLGLGDLLERSEGLLLAAIAPERPELHEAALRRLAEAAPGRLRLAVALRHGPQDRRLLFRARHLAARLGVPLLAVADALYDVPNRKSLLDVMTCIREHVTIHEAGRRLGANAERCLRAPDEMARLFRDAPEAVAETLRLAASARFSLDELAYKYPDEPVPDGLTPQEALERLAREGARARYPDGVPVKVQETIERELGLIAELDYARYFLTIHDIVQFARKEGILYQGRGSAANSAVCYCLRITEVDPEQIELLFERFISPERSEPPDIDVDFEHERREKVIQWIYARYGRDRAGLAATVITYRARGAIREVGKVFGLSEDAVSAAAGLIWGWSSKPMRQEDLRQAGLDPDDPNLRTALQLAGALIRCPRHLSQHVGGFVITRGRLDETVPITNAAMDDRTVIEWDKDDLDVLGMFKIDILALGMLTAIRKALALIAAHYDDHLTLASIPKEETAVYAMLTRADSIGVFQVESRAQMTMLPRLQPKSFYDLVIEVAIVRPGPIQGGMVHPYLRRRADKEEARSPKPELDSVLEKTCGVPIFQEQAMRIAIVAAGFKPTEADELRRAMATFRKAGTIHTLKERFIKGMLERDYPLDFAERCFSQLEGFGTYGFPESHAASFALLVYASAWIKCRYPDAFAAALLNSQPMGFYAPAQLVRDAEEHGVEMRAADVNHSFWDSTLEPGRRAAEHLHPRHASMVDDIWTRHAVRLGFRQIKGFREEDAQALVAARGRGYDSVRHVWLASGLGLTALERLADADAFRSLGLDRRAALWAVRALGDRHLPLFDEANAPDPQSEPDFALPPMPLGEHVVNDYRSLGLSLKAHPVSFLRRALAARRHVPAFGLRSLPTDSPVTVSGLVLVRQRPGSASGVIFMTLEDETGIANAVIWPAVFERFRPIVLGARLVAITGRLQSEQSVIHIVARRIEDLTPMLTALSEDGAGMEPRARAAVKRLHARTHPLTYAPDDPSSVMPKGRNFH